MKVYLLKTLSKKHGIKEVTLRHRLISRGLGHKFGTLWVVNESEVEELLREGVVGNPNWGTKRASVNYTVDDTIDDSTIVPPEV